MKTNFPCLVWVARSLVIVVTILNLQAAFQFMLQPQDYVAGFELSGIPGEVMLQGMGLLFLMWNIPYIAALIHPLRNFVSLVEAVVMQAIGVVGESLILASLIGVHPAIHASAMRFIYFDGGGLILLLVALGLMLIVRKAKSTSHPRSDQS